MFIPGFVNGWDGIPVTIEDVFRMDEALLTTEK